MKSAGRQQPSAVRADRRIIERPRLIKLLDDTDARTILLLAPAGYGKTTLARQWAKTLNKAVWISLSSAHTDVAWLAEDIAQAIESGEGEAVRTIREHIRARANPQRSARELGRVLADALEESDVRWLIFDDYHEIVSSDAAEELISTIDRVAGSKTLISTRVRPRWASGRRFVYGEIFELSQRDLAMTEDEVAKVLGRKPSAAHLSDHAQGWPAVIGLAAAAPNDVLPVDALPHTLHRYLAEELFQRASHGLREALLAITLQGQRTCDLSAWSSDSSIAAEAEQLGFGSNAEGFELHPLLREFLLEKLMALPDADARVRAAVSEACGRGAWDHALSLVVRFALDDLAEPVLANAYKPLSRSGRLATLERFVHAVQARRQQTPRSAQVILAEAAFSDGDLELALDLAEAVLPQLQDDHPAASRAAALVGQIAVLKADFAAGERGFQRAQDVATDERDASEAAYGIATAAVFGEHPAAKGAVKILREARNKSPIDFLRFVTSETALRLLGGIPNGLSGNLHLDAARALLPNADDPRARTGLTYTLASALSQRAQYAEAREWLSLCFADAEKYELEFPLPYANWTLAHVAMGQRRFGEAERALQAIEDVAARKGQPHHALSAQTLRARLLLQTGQPEAALLCVAASPVAPVIPSWRAEYLATRALIHACLGNQSASSEDVGLAEQTSGALQVRGLTQASRAVAGLDDSGRAVREVTQLFSTAARLDVWDPVVCAVRSAPAVADVVAAQVELRPTLEGLCHRTGDVSLGRRMGLRVRSTSKPRDILSPREYEVLELIARGYKNREISRALYIAESTTKVHVRHVLEKLGVRTRAEAAARWQMFERD